MFYNKKTTTTTVFEIFNPNGAIFYASPRSDWPSLSAEKTGLSLSYLVPEILGPKVGLIVCQNIYYLAVLSILHQFSPCFSIQFTFIFIDLKSFWPLILTKPYIRLCTIFWSWSTPTPPGYFFIRITVLIHINMILKLITFS